MILDSDFNLDVYTDIYLTVKGAKNLDTYSEKYQNLIDSVTEDIDKIKENQIETRYNQVISEAKKELDKGENEYNENKEKSEN